MRLAPVNVTIMTYFSTVLKMSTLLAKKWPLALIVWYCVHQRIFVKYWGHFHSSQSWQQHEDDKEHTCVNWKTPQIEARYIPYASALHTSVDDAMRLAHLLFTFQSFSQQLPPFSVCFPMPALPFALERDTSRQVYSSGNGTETRPFLPFDVKFSAFIVFCFIPSWLLSTLFLYSFDSIQFWKTINYDGRMSMSVISK